MSKRRWSSWHLARAITGFILHRWVPEGPVRLAGDDTVAEHRGPKVYGKARHRDAVRSTHSFTAYRWGHKWVTLAILVRFPFSQRLWALPVRAKARKVAETETGALIIGSDQVAVMGTRVLGKPGNHDAAVAQLTAMSGNTVVFHTALCLLNARSGKAQLANVPTTVRFRRLDAAQIERYLLQDRPYDCAGSAKIEALGIALVESVDSADPTALIGLPLIALVDMLQREGVSVP